MNRRSVRKDCWRNVRSSFAAAIKVCAISARSGCPRNSLVTNSGARAALGVENIEGLMRIHRSSSAPPRANAHPADVDRRLDQAALRALPGTVVSFQLAAASAGNHRRNDDAGVILQRGRHVVKVAGGVATKTTSAARSSLSSTIGTPN